MSEQQTPPFAFSLEPSEADEAHQALFVNAHQQAWDLMPEEGVAQHREEMASMRLERPFDPCESCEVLPYSEAVKLFPRDENGLKLHEGWRHCMSNAGVFKKCAACETIPWETREWIRAIPLDRYRAFMRAHPYAFLVEELRKEIPV